MGFVSGYVRFVSKIWPIIILAWLGLLIFGIIRGPNLLLHTDNEVHETAGTLSAQANAVMSENFDFSSYTPWIIVAECSKNFEGSTSGCSGGTLTPVIDVQTHMMFDEVTKLLLDHHSETFDESLTYSYFQFADGPLDTLKKNFISSNGTLTYLQLGARRNVTQAIRFNAYHTLKKELPRIARKFCPNCSYVGTTGGDQLTADVSEGLAEMLLKTNAVIMPLAMGLLIYMIGNWRLLIITVFNLAVVLLGSFALCDVISDYWSRPQSITPQMMEAIASACTIDYSLFMFTRFIGELETKRKRWNIRRHQYFLTVHSDTTTENDNFVNPMHTQPVYGQEYFGLIFDKSLDSVDDPHPGMTNPGAALLISALISTLEHSGHVVGVSGLTLLLAFSGFLITRCDFLIQPAIFTAIAVALAILTALSTTIAFITGFRSFFTDTNPFPAWMYSCCCKDRRTTMMFDTDWTGDEIFVEDPDDILYQASTQAAANYGSSAPNRFQSHQSFAYENQGFPSAVNDFEGSRNTNPKYNDNSSLLNNRHGYGTNDSSGIMAHSPSQVVAIRGVTKDVSTVIDIEKFHSSKVYKCGRFLIKTPWNILVILTVFAFMGFAAYWLKDISLSSAYALGIPSNSSALKALKKMEVGFSPGIIQPFYLLINWSPEDHTDAPSPTSPLIFQRGAEYLKTFTDATGIGPENTRSVFFWNESSQYIDDPSKFPDDPAYFAMLSQTLSANDTDVTYLITLLSPISPDSPAITDLIQTIRTNVTQPLDQKYNTDISNPTRYYLSGYKATEVDTIDSAQSRFPLMLGTTFAVVITIVAIFLKSVFVPIRLALTLALPIAATFGLQVLVFQHGILEWTGLECFNPAIHQIYWELPPFCAVVLLSLALDYDIFIISRIAEHRVNGYTNTSSILMGLFDTGSVITAAAMIMVLTFSSLLFLKSAATSQLGFCLVVSIAIDAFITRTILVPAIMSLGDKIGWWPRRVPYTGLKHYDGTIVN